MQTLFSAMRAVTRLNERIGRLVAPLILALFVLLFAEVLLRYFFRSPTVWTNELAQLLFGAYAVLSGGYLLARGGHVNVDIVHSKFPRRVRAVIDIFTSVLFFLFVVVLLWLGVSFALESIATFETSHSAWNPPIWPFKAIIPIAATLLLLQGIVKLIADICIALGGAVPGDIVPRHDADDDARKEAL